MFQKAWNEFEHSFIPEERVVNDALNGYPTNACTGGKVLKHTCDIVRSVCNLTINPLSFLEWSLKCRMIMILNLHEILPQGTDPPTTFCVLNLVKPIQSWYHSMRRASMYQETILRWPSLYEKIVYVSWDNFEMAIFPYLAGKLKNVEKRSAEYHAASI